MALDLLCVKVDETYSSVGGCEEDSSGVDTMWYINKQFVTGFTLTANVITAWGISGTNFMYEFTPYTETAECDWTGTINEAGNSTYLHNAKFRFKGVNTDSVQLGYKIHRGQGILVVKMNSGKYWCYGAVTAAAPHLDRGMRGKVIAGKNGIKSEDASGVEIELEAKMNKPPYEVDPTSLTGLTVAA
jgi:hypothetical protein